MGKVFRQFKHVFVAILILGIIIPLFIQIIILLMQQTNLKDDTMLNSHHILYVDLELRKTQINSLSAQINELEDVRLKAVNELLQLDQERVKLNSEIENLRNKKSETEKYARDLSKTINNYKKEIGFLEKVRQQSVVTNYVYVGLPKSSVKVDSFTHKTIENPNTCSLSTCFDYSKCSILNDFAINFNRPENSANNIYLDIFKKNIKDSKSRACLTLLIFDSKTLSENLENIIARYAKLKNENVMIYLHDNSLTNYCDIFQNISSVGSVISNKLCPSFRVKFDMMVPSFPVESKTSSKALPMLLPVKRKNLLFFYSELKSKTQPCGDGLSPDDLTALASDFDINIKVKCRDDTANVKETKKLYYNCHWRNCLTLDQRIKELRNSIFNLIIVDFSNPDFFSHIMESFLSSTIPVLLGRTELMPYKDVINWKLACVYISYQRIPELTYTLRTISMERIFFLKLQGRFLYESYFRTLSLAFQTVITAFKNFIELPPSKIHDIPSIPLLNVHSALQDKAGSGRMLQIRDLNYTYLGIDAYRTWNTYPGALDMFPVISWNKPAPPRLQFLDEYKDLYMPIGNGKGGDGASFSRSLGGDYQFEQFTIIMLTYDRNEILIEALLRLSGLKYLHKVLVVWNNRQQPPKDMQWPDIGAKIEVVYGKKNSLNNRFIPYENIKTEAILSMDDDIYLRHDEIELAFRIWRENRDRLVGFPGRHHGYNSSSQSFYYDSEHSCELSLVLTGGAFFHKYYSYVYTFKLDESIRQMVDQYMNCEDIAMNFLISHITQKPPVKVTSRWTFRCSGCNDTLALDPNHYEERHKCIQNFEKVFGYNSLKRTQFRADSVLFKTRLPSGLKKCFQYV